MRHYFIGFSYWRKNGDAGVASTTIDRESSVAGRDDILEIMKIICGRNPDFDNVVVTNWRRFEDPE